MDVQMPELDGFAATAAIRARERASGTHIPIIAMTARTMHGDRERCLAAGMDSYIGKPLEIDTFAQAVAMLALATGASRPVPQAATEAQPLPGSLAKASRISAKSNRQIFDYDRLHAQTLGKPELLAVRLSAAARRDSRGGSRRRCRAG
jgi:DNA-binding response OmpR family regulator